VYFSIHEQHAPYLAPLDGSGQVGVYQSLIDALSQQTQQQYQAIWRSNDADLTQLLSKQTIDFVIDPPSHLSKANAGGYLVRCFILGSYGGGNAYRDLGG
jgi:hypothetical protein